MQPAINNCIRRFYSLYELVFYDLAVFGLGWLSSVHTLCPPCTVFVTGYTTHLILCALTNFCTDKQQTTTSLEKLHQRIRFLSKYFIAVLSTITNQEINNNYSLCHKIGWQLG